LTDVHKIKPFVIGESLPPECKPILEQLGLWNDFKGDGHRPCYGNQSVWGHLSLQSTDFINSPWGHGWNIDRIKFERMLRNSAKQNGVDFYLGTKIVKIERLYNNKWHLKLASSHYLNANFIVDATGRAGWLAIRLGSKRCHMDHQVALVSKFKNNNSYSDQDSTTLIEAVEKGWWYSAVIPSGFRVVIFFTDGIYAHLFKEPSTFLKEIHNTAHISKRIIPFYSMIEEPKVILSNTSILDKLVGKNWLSVGDAAVAHDPISSYGLMWSLKSSINAALTVTTDLKGDDNDNTALGKYEKKIKVEFSYFIDRLRNIYRRENRFPQSKYWNRF
jgi:flavin-dependent dehydrogenase